MNLSEARIFINGSTHPELWPAKYSTYALVVQPCTKVEVYNTGNACMQFA